MMRRSLLHVAPLFLLAAMLCPDARAQTQLQNRESENTSSVSSFTLAYSGAVTLHSLLVAQIRLGSNSDSPITVSDNVNAGNWTQAFLVNDATNGRYLGLYYKEDAAAGTPTVTLAYSIADASPKGLDIFEYSGMATSSSLDGQNSAVTASTSTPNSGNITTTNANDLIFGAYSFSTAATTTQSSEATSFTQELNDTLGTATHNHLHVASRTVSSTATYSYQPTLSAAQVCVIGVAAFKTASAGAGGVSKRDKIEKQEGEK